MRLPGGPLASVRRLRARPGRSLVAALGIAAAAAMLGTALTVGYGLHTGFDRAADRADLPDVIARFDNQPVGRVESRLRALPDLQATAYRQEYTSVPIFTGRRQTGNGIVQVVGPGRRGYAIVAGRDVRGPRDTVVERGLARSWHVRVGQELGVGQGRLRVVGIAVSPDNVAFPLAKGPRVYVDRSALGPGFVAHPRTNLALIWLNDPSQLAPVLTQARAASFGVGGLTFLTRSGVRTTIDQAAGIVIALLVAFSVIALASAGVMLAASASADVQRRLQGIGVARALGFSPGSVAAQYALDSTVLALPAGMVGIAAGALVSYGSSSRLLESINELPPGAALLGPLALGLVAVIALVAAASAWPAWRAARRPVVAVLRGGDVAPAVRTSRLPAGFVGLGMRLAATRRRRMLATVAVLGVSGGVVLTMLAMAHLLDRLQHDPGLVGKRYQLTVDLPPSRARAVARIPGVAAAAPRYVTFAADSFQLGEGLKVVAYPGDHTPFEAPPLAAGRRVRSPGEAEVGTGVADALGVEPGAELALELPTGREVRFRVVGLVRAFDNDGRVIYTQPPRLLAADPSLSGPIAVKLADGANQAAVERRLRRLGAPPPQPATTATTRNAGFLGVLAALLRAVALVDGIVCLYILVQALALTARERRSTIAVLRASGAGGREVRLVLLGAALVAVLGAAPLAVAVELLVFAPAVSRLAASYVSLPLGVQIWQVAIVVLGMLVLAAAAAALAARQLGRERVVAGLRSD
ncbi:MAG TPA: FtsX-like permease family protein [Thermoleophilaceae bacterium]